MIVWDAKYRAPGGSYPASLPNSKLQAWQSEIINSVKNMPEGQAKTAAEGALKAGRVEGRIQVATIGLRYLRCKNGRRCAS